MILNQIIESIYCKWLYGWIYNYERWKKEWKMRRQSRLKKRSCIRRRKDEKTIEIDTGFFWEDDWWRGINMISYWLIFKIAWTLFLFTLFPFYCMYDTLEKPRIGLKLQPNNQSKIFMNISYTVTLVRSIFSLITVYTILTIWN